MDHKKSSFDTDNIGAIIGVILFIAVPIILIIWSNGQADTSTKNSTETYSEYDQWSDENRQDQADGEEQKRELEHEFEGYDCTSDCSGHQAGYDWAQSNNVCDPYYSGGNSQSFDEGVRSWASGGC